MKRIMTCFICFILCISFVPVALAQKSESEGASLIWVSGDMSFEAAVARKLEKLGLFQGIGENGDGTADFGLEKNVTRVQALIMLIRMLGKEADAREYPKTHPFSDVPAWADGYISYAYDEQLTKGVSDTLFGTEDRVTAEMYLTFMLRALGYSEGKGKEFTWHTPWALASYCGILPARVNRTDFLRADAVTVTCAALYAGIKGTQTTLSEQLMSEGVFTEEQFNTVFPVYPFENDRMLDDRLSLIIAERGRVGVFEDNKYSTESHFITDITEDSDVLTVSFMVCYLFATLDSSNGIKNYSGTIDLWQAKLDAKTLQCLSCHTAGELLSKGLALTEYFSEKSLAVRDLLSTDDSIREGIWEVCKMKTQALIDNGSIKYQKPTYKSELDKATASYSEIIRTIETDLCTILLGKPADQKYYEYQLYLIFKSGSAIGDGATKMIASSSEGDLWLSEDGLTLYYSYHYENGAVYVGFPPTGGDLPESGTCNYTISLNNGGTTIQVTAD